ncbi:Uncharacterized protein C24B11.05 [Linum perenne]
MEYKNCHLLQAQNMKYECLLFDLDDTLYPYSSGLAAACGRNINGESRIFISYFPSVTYDQSLGLVKLGAFADYMVEHLGIDKSQIVELGNLLYKNYGTTMAGLRAIGYEFDYDEYHSYVHGRLPYENLKPDPVLRTLLLSLPIRKLIFTNADKVHAVKALNKLGLEDCFERIICFETLNPIHKTNASDDIQFVGTDGSAAVNGSTTVNNNGRGIFDIVGHFAKPNSDSLIPKSPIVCKPSEAAIELALKIANINPHTTLFFEDSVRNIQSGKRVGLHTVLVGSCQRVKDADFALESIHNVRQVIPGLWEADIKKSSSSSSEVVGYKGKVAVEQSVTA